MEIKDRVLIVEDDKNIRKFIQTILEANDYDVIATETGKEAYSLITSRCPDVVILDLGLPDMDGMEIIKKVRSWSNLPIIVISARSEDGDKIEALDAGADDYLTKPFSVEELLARLRVTLRRLQYINTQVSQEQQDFVNGDLRIDYVSGCVYLKGEELHVTSTEYKLLKLLAKNVGKVLTHTYITREIWGSAWDSDVVSLRVFMATLRKKIEENPSQPKYIQTHIGVGYRMLRVPNK